jgi:ribosomal-protein-alanine N-acetyltransferase
MIREARPGDRPELRAIRSVALPEPSPGLLAAATDGPLVAYVADVGEVVGYAVVVGGDGTVAHLPELAVRPAHQGRGHGTRLLETLTDRLAGDYESLHVVVRVDQERVRAFYASRGFERVDRLPAHFETADGLLLARRLG